MFTRNGSEPVCPLSAPRLCPHSHPSPSAGHRPAPRAASSVVRLDWNFLRRWGLGADVEGPGHAFHRVLALQSLAQQLRGQSLEQAPSPVKTAHSAEQASCLGGCQWVRPPLGPGPGAHGTADPSRLPQMQPSPSTGVPSPPLRGQAALVQAWVRKQVAP